MNNIHIESGQFRTRDGEKLELNRAYADKDAPILVSAPGLGGSARQYPLTDELAKDFHVVSFGPRGSGRSRGVYGIKEYGSDLAEVMQKLTEERGRKPFFTGFSMGGHVGARILSREALAEKAVLVAPYVGINEQMPPAVLSFLKMVGANPNVARAIAKPLAGVVGNSYDCLNFGEQRLHYDKLPEFFDSLTKSNEFGWYLQVPTLVALPGASWMRIPTSKKELAKQKRVWEILGTKVDLYPESNHWFSGGKYHGDPANYGKEAESSGLLERMKEFLK